MSLITNNAIYRIGSRAVDLWTWSKRVKNEAQVDLRGKIDLSESGTPIFTPDVIKQTSELVQDLGVACFPRPLSATRDVLRESLCDGYGVGRLQISGVCQTAGHILRTKPQVLFPNYSGDEEIDVRVVKIAANFKTKFHKDRPGTGNNNSLVSIGYESNDAFQDNGLELIYNWLHAPISFFQPYYRFKCDLNEYPFVILKEGPIFHANRDLKQISKGERSIRKVDVIPMFMSRESPFGNFLIPVNEASEEKLLKYAQSILVYR